MYTGQRGTLAKVSNGILIGDRPKKDLGYNILQIDCSVEENRI